MGRPRKNPIPAMPAMYDPDGKPESDREPIQINDLPEDVSRETVSRDAVPAEYDDASAARRQAEDIRRKRTRPFGSMTQKLALPERPYYKRHWFNDTPGRVQMARESGWTHVRDGDEPIKRVVGSGRDGGALNAYAMEIPKEIYEEEAAARHAMAQAKVDEFKRNPFRAQAGAAQQSDVGKFYSPEADPLTVKSPGR